MDAAAAAVAHATTIDPALVAREMSCYNTICTALQATTAKKLPPSRPTFMLLLVLVLVLVLLLRHSQSCKMPVTFVVSAIPQPTCPVLAK